MSPSLLTPRVRRVAIVALGLLWAASIGGTAATMSNGKPFAGFAILILGWTEVPLGQPAWLANLFLLAAWLLIARTRVTRPRLLTILGIALMACAIAALFWRTIPDTTGPKAIVTYHAGYYLWMAAVIGTSLAAVAIASTESSRE
ncbi:hypothetical protein [Sphingomonas spermidinifaciens]|uniref:hypothetical protein n=1 Tax=Sphingomonas spermidinifaciens TaxID=1141889 RepID=UPI001142F5BD|nr:hypothetical protein [Sphingomonas spermidinifaciens]